jgi:hypothetical protein
MSHCTLINQETNGKNSLIPEYIALTNKSVFPNSSYTPDDDEESQVYEYADPPIIHPIKLGDTVKSICNMYNLDVRNY